MQSGILFLVLRHTTEQLPRGSESSFALRYYEFSPWLGVYPDNYGPRLRDNIAMNRMAAGLSKLQNSKHFYVTAAAAVDDAHQQPVPLL